MTRSSRPQHALTRLASFGALAALMTGSALVAGTSATSASEPGDGMGTISGSLVDADGDPVFDGGVEAWRLYGEGEDASWEFYDGAYVSDGSYALTLSEGTYRFSYEGYETQSKPEWWNNARSLETADDIEVTDEDRTLATVELDDPAQLTGSVENTLGEPLANIDVEAYDKDSEGYWSPTYTTTTDENGHYSLPYMGAEGYKLGFEDDYNDDYAPEFWQNKSTLEDADLVSVPGDDPTHAVGTAVLSRGGTITGTVKADNDGAPLKGVMVTALDDTGEPVAGDNTDATGKYVITRLGAGDYTLQFSDQFNDYASEYYNNIPADTDLSGADPRTYLHIDGDDDVEADANAGLATQPFTKPVGTVGSGTVTSNTGTPIAGAWVYAYNDEDYGFAVTNRKGQYFLEGLSGAYTVVFEAPYDEDSDQQEFIDEYWNNRRYESNATKVTFTEGSEVSNLNVKLDRFAKISGVLTDKQGAPVSDGWVELIDVDGNEADWVDTDASGRYEFDEVYPDTYRLQFAGDNSNVSLTSIDENRDFVSEWYSNAASMVEAAPVLLGEGRNLTNINATLTTSLETYVAPTVNGVPLVGRALSATTGSWNVRAQAEYTYRWLSGATVVGTDATYVPKASDVGKQLKVEVTNTLDDWKGTSTSALTAAVRHVSGTTVSGTSPKKGVAKVTMTVKVAGVANPGGKVTLKDGRYTKKTVSVVNGKAVVTLTKQRTGKHVYSAVYTGTGAVLGSTSAKVTVRVK